jgi:hypothetical protein
MQRTNDEVVYVKVEHKRTIVWDYGDLERDGDGEVVVKRRKRTTH